MTTLSEHPVDVAAELKLALRRLAKSVVVITCRHDGRNYAMPATAVDALSMDPPSVLVCVNKSASIHPAIAVGGRFAINILHRNHEILSLHCEKAKGEERFSLGAWRNLDDAPVLSDAQANIVCNVDARFEYGTHTIFIGRVLDVGTFGEIDPLIYVDGRYTALTH